MDSISHLLGLLKPDSRLMVATIIATSGSTPVGALSKMLIHGDGTRATGTVGGGCMEGDVLDAARKLHQDNKAAILTFHLNEDEVIQGLICGGNLDVLVEPVDAYQRELYERLKSIRDRGEDCVIATHLGSDGKIRFKAIVTRGDLQGSSVSSPSSWLAVMEYWRFVAKKSSVDLDVSLPKVLQRSQGERLPVDDGVLILEPVLGRPHLVVFGGGHVSLYVTRVAAMAGFRVSVVDDRIQFANKERFPEAEETIAVEFYDAMEKLSITPTTYVVIVTRGHRSDEEILGRVVKTQAKYIGMIGSKRKVLATFKNLMKDGVGREVLENVRAPMGLNIGAATAEEIAVSIVAEMIQVRRGATLPVQLKSVEMATLLQKQETS